MAEKTESIAQTISGAVTQNRKRLMGFGILSLIFGVIGTFMSVTMTLTSIILFGILIVAGGLMFLVEAFSAPEWKGKLFNLLIAILYIAAGIVMITNPAGSAVWFTLFLAAFFIVIGVFRIIMAFKVKDELDSWVWIIISGIINITLGILIYAQWPGSGLWVIGLFISIELIMQGISAIILSREVNTVQKDIQNEFGS